MIVAFRFTVVPLTPCGSDGTRGWLLYTSLALSRHHGNVARAARASSKHRRAFWALMRKHGIDAAPYRRQAALHAEDAADAG